MHNLNLYRNLIIYSLIVPLAIFLGFLSTNPTSYFGMIVIMLVITLLLSPIILKWHHWLAILSVNLYLNVFFLPGQPQAWGVMALVSLAITFLGWVINKKRPLIWENQMALPLLLLLAVVLVTAALTGGISGRALGANQWGAARYMSTILGIVIFFAISMVPTKPENAKLLILLYLVMGLSAIISNLIYLAGPSFYFMFNFFPVEFSALAVDSSGSGLQRFSGVSTAAQFSIIAMLSAYGLKGIFVMRSPWRFILFFSFFAIGLLGGFRSFLAHLFILSLILFYLEGMFRFKYVFTVILISVLCFTGLIGFSTKLPLSMQRAISFIPFVKVAPSVRIDAEGSLDWRFQMWKIVVPEIPKYLLLGKGFTFDGTDYLITNEAIARNQLPAYESTLVSGNYHNGLLTLIIPFGIFGTILFFWFLYAAWRHLYRHYKSGPPELRPLNLFMFAYFTQQVFHFVVFYGQFDIEIFKFTSLAALSVSINRGYAFFRLSSHQSAPVLEAEEGSAPTMPGLGSAIPSGNA